jgi:hypothetical protein
MVIHTIEEWMDVAYGLNLTIYKAQGGYFAYDPEPKHSIVGRFYPEFDRGYIDDDKFKGSV